MAGPLYARPMRLVQNRVFRGYPGGREIDRFRGLPSPQDDKRPEAWVGSTTRVNSRALFQDSNLGLAKVYLPDGGRVYLKDVIEKNPPAFLGEVHSQKYGSNTGVLVKLLDAQKQLGLQTHPDREYARRVFDSDFGKTESWYVIGTRKDQGEEPYVLLGFKEGISREEFQEYYEQGDIAAMENCCHRIPVSVGDMFFVDAGVPHAIGPGCFVVEVQEPSDITVGVRKRDFADKEEERQYTEKVMGCFHYNGRSYEENLKAYRIEPVVLRENPAGTEMLLLGSRQTTYFSITRIDVRGDFEARDTKTFSIVIVLEGKGKLIWKDGEMDIRKGDELFLPASVEGLRWMGDLAAVRCYPPDVL
mgnify:CR=1 FL=1